MNLARAFITGYRALRFLAGGVAWLARSLAWRQGMSLLSGRGRRR